MCGGGTSPSQRQRTKFGHLVWSLGSSVLRSGVMRATPPSGSCNHIAFQGINRCCLHLSLQSASVPSSHPPSVLPRVACSCFFSVRHTPSNSPVLTVWCMTACPFPLHLLSSHFISLPFTFFFFPLHCFFLFCFSFLPRCCSLTNGCVIYLFIYLAIWTVMMLALPRCWELIALYITTDDLQKRQYANMNSYPAVLSSVLSC